MSHRIRRATSVVAMFAASTAAVTLGATESASAASFSASVATNGSIGTMWVDAIYDGQGGGGAYDTGYSWRSDGGLWNLNMSTYTETTPAGSLSVNGSPTIVRLELYPKPEPSQYFVPYDVWAGNVGGANVQRDKSRDGANWLDFGQIPLPTVGQDGAFRVEGGIVSATPVPDGRVQFDVFQIPCSYPETCPDTKRTSTGAAVGAFATGSSKGGRWSGGVGWPGHYIVFVRDTFTGSHVHGFMDIANGQVPDLDLDVACFGMRTCVYDQGSASVPQGGFHPLNPTRLLDTRTGVGINSGAMRPGDGRLGDPNPVNRRAETRNHEVKVTGVAGIPASGVSAVLLNVTAVAPPSWGFVSVAPRPPAVGDIFNDQATYSGFPSTSNLNLTGGETVPNLVLARVGAGGTIRFTYAGFGSMHVIADVAGWFDTGAPGVLQGGLGFTGVAPARLLDTRSGIGDKIGRFRSGDDRALKVTGVAGVPVDAQSVVVNITSGSPSRVGYVTAYPDGQARPNASNLNVNAGQTRSNLAGVKGGANGMNRLAALETDTDLVVDVFGYYSAGGGATTTITPVRVVDSRIGLGTAGRAFGPHEARDVQVAGVSVIPGNATAVVLNVTAVDTSSWGWLTVWPAGQRQPASSNLNWDAGRFVPNLVIVAVGANGSVSIYNDNGNANILVDVLGYVT